MLISGTSRGHSKNSREGVHLTCSQTSKEVGVSATVNIGTTGVEHTCKRK